MGVISIRIAATTMVVAAGIAVWLRNRRLARAVRVIARYPTRVRGRRWYKEVVVTETGGSAEVVRALHLGSEHNEPESRCTLRHGEIVAGSGLLLKEHLQYALLAFGWLDRGFELEDGARAALIGVAGGSLLHFWRECVPGGAALSVDAVEIDGAVLEAAREHMQLGACQRVQFHVADGAQFLREAEDEVYDLLVVDLDMGSLVGNPAEEGACSSTGKSDDTGGGGEGSGESRLAAARRHLRKIPDDPTRDMYRVLSSRGVLIINEYSEGDVCHLVSNLSRQPLSWTPVPLSCKSMPASRASKLSSKLSSPR
mgnify:CR=1 FL=1